MALPEGYGVATLHWAQTGGMSDITVTCAFEDAGALEPNDVAEAIESYFTGGDCPCYPTQMTVGWTFVGVSVLINSAGDLYSGQHYNNIVGTAVDSAPPVPAYSPMVVTKYTAKSGIQYRGRMYPPFTLSDAENINQLGAIEAINLGVLRGTWENAFDLWRGGANKPYLLHNEPKEGGPIPAPTPITSFYVQPNVGTQRRRKNRA